MSGGHGSGGGGRSGGFAKTSIVLVLVAGLLIVHHFGVREGFDPSAMLALGFVVLASYAFGQLVERIRLPHITGYLVAGILLGPSVASLLPAPARVPPFDAGVLSTSVQGQLSPLVTLAVALIALTAGGELKIATLRRGFRAIVAIIAGQSVFVLLSVTGLVLLIGGAVPALRLPGLGDLGMTSIAALGAVVAAVSLATSPSATIAVVTETRAKGPMTTLVLASVVLKDVVVVFFFSLASTIAVQALGVGESVDLGAFLLVHVGGSLAFGVFVGGAMALYLRFVNRELLVFVVGVVFAARFAAEALHLDPVLLFIAAGFAVSNFSDRGGALVSAVETLSLPVYVVFFTLAGAHLDLHLVLHVLPFAIALTATRALAIALGSRLGAVLGHAPEAVRRHAWLGYVSQAGVALSLSTIVAERFGEPGRALASLLLATIAIDELAGPVLFKLGLGLARELPPREGARESVVADAPTPGAGEAEPEEATGTHGERGASTDEASAPGARAVAPWPAPEVIDPWEGVAGTGAADVDAQLVELRRDLERVVEELRLGPIVRFRADGDAFVRELRRELLRMHRRVAVAAQGAAAGAGDAATEAAVVDAIRAGLSELADRFRASVVARGARIRHHDETLVPIAAALDDLASQLPETVRVPWREGTFEPREDDGPLRRGRRAWLRARRAWARTIGAGLAPRRAPLRALATYHLGGVAPVELEGVAALLVQGDLHQLARCRGAIEMAVREYGSLAKRLRERAGAEPRAVNGHAGAAGAIAPEEAAGARGEAGDGNGARGAIEPGSGEGAIAHPAIGETAPPGTGTGTGSGSADDQETALDLPSELARIRAELDREIELAGVELEHIGSDLELRAARVAALALHRIAADLLLIGTPDLDDSARAPSRTFAQRNAALATLDGGYRAAREATAASYALLSLELELVELQGRVADVLREQASELARSVRGRAQRQVERVIEAIDEAVSQIEVTMSAELPASRLAEALGSDTEGLVRVAGDAHRALASLRDQLAAEDAVAGLLDALVKASQSLTERYTLPATPMPRSEWRLPAAIETVEIPFRDWIVAHVESTLGPRIFATSRGIASAAEKLALALSELERRIAFNVELASSELAPLGEEAPSESAIEIVRSLLIGTLQRNRELFVSYRGETEKWVADVQTGLDTTLRGGLETLREELVQGQVSRLRVRMVKQAVQRRALRRQLSEIRGTVVDSAARLGRRARVTLGEERLERLRRAVGLPLEVASSAPSTTALAPAAPSARVPVVYRRVFSAQALEAGDILTGREAALEQARAALEDRGAGLRTAALIGPDGVGKSAFIDAVLRGKKWKSIARHELEAPASREDVAKILDVRGEGGLVIVAGVSYLYSLRPGGAEPLRAFVEGVVRDGGRNAFLVRADDVVWAQASALAPLGDAFPERVPLAPLDRETLRATVLARHAVSGYGLVFSDGEREESAFDAVAARAFASIARPQEAFFRALHEASGGLVRDALRLWLASVRDVDETTDLVHVGPVPPSPLLWLRRLDEDAVLALYQVARQGWMSARVLAWLLADDEIAAEARLLRLAHLGVLARRGDHYRVPVHLRGALHRLLIERGLLSATGLETAGVEPMRGGAR